MKPIRAIKNQYIGINAHLHSLWQAEGGWDEFHASHIIYYLHESAPTFPGIPNYRPGENGHAHARDAHPYRIVVVDPRPALMQGTARLDSYPEKFCTTSPVGPMVQNFSGVLCQFDVDEALPVVDIPLQGGDVLAFDFGEPYTRTLEESMFGLDVDYSQLPLNFQRYRKDDRGRIAMRIVALLNAVSAGVDLETGPLPVKAMTLEVALAELEALQ